MSSIATRMERDSMGDMEVAADAYFGASTQRAILNFPISDLRFQDSFIRALCLLKSAAAKVNRDSGALKPELADAIVKAADEAAAGRFRAHFSVDIFQTGSGTSTNMNANEVIANRAIEILGGPRGARNLVHPNDHVNMGMSSNDAIPTAIHVAALLELQEQLLPALEGLRDSLSSKSKELWNVIKTGRTHLQDATPIRLGQEFLGYEGMITRSIEKVQLASDRLSEVALGGTAVGTGINTHPEFAAKVLSELSLRTGLSLRETSNHFQAQSTLDEVVFASSALKSVAVSLMKIANDIRWLGCGPRAGLAEVALPEVQPGSSIMPGKVNPVIAESVCMVCAQVMGNDVTVAIAGQAGNFELNVMMPVAAFNLIQSIQLLATSCKNFSSKCIQGIVATEAGPAAVERGLALCTALVPAIGYDLSAAIAKEAAHTGKSIREVARERTQLSNEQLNQILDPFQMTEPQR